MMNERLPLWGGILGYCGIGGTHGLTPVLDGIGASQDHGIAVTAGHELGQPWEEWLPSVFRVKLFGGEEILADSLLTDDDEALFLDSLFDCIDVSVVDSIGLDHGKCALQFYRHRNWLGWFDNFCGCGCGFRRQQSGRLGDRCDLGTRKWPALLRWPLSPVAQILPSSPLNLHLLALRRVQKVLQWIFEELVLEELPEWIELQDWPPLEQGSLKERMIEVHSLEEPPKQGLSGMRFLGQVPVQVRKSEAEVAGQPPSPEMFVPQPPICWIPPMQVQPQGQFLPVSLLTQGGQPL